MRKAEFRALEAAELRLEQAAEALCGASPYRPSNSVEADALHKLRVKLRKRAAEYTTACLRAMTVSVVPRSRKGG